MRYLNQNASEMRFRPVLTVSEHATASQLIISFPRPPLLDGVQGMFTARAEFKMEIGGFQY
jgi:hypothetical protein